MNETSIFGELEPSHYFIYQGGEHEDKDKDKKREPLKYYYTNIEPVLLDDNKTLQVYGIRDNGLFHVNVQKHGC